MGKVVNKSFCQVRRSIAKKSDKLMIFLQDNSGNLFDDDWKIKHNKIYERLQELCCDVIEEISNLDEIEVPDYD